MSTKHAILGVFSWGPGSGYNVKGEMEKGGLGWIWELSYGSIYPKLEAMAAEGLIAPVETQTEGRERTTYDLTAKGWREMDRWLCELPEFPLPLKDELLLRILFWGAVRPEDRETLIKHLEARKAFCEAMLAKLRQPMGYENAADEYHMYLGSYAEHRLYAEIAWADSTIYRLKGPAQPPFHDPRNVFERARQRRAATEAAEQEQEG
ncbi:MAG TPA: PadR family transcriptional regulator [Symbiobacteriaceae bacterium]|nr:PadR family transcriptional regulator [Symbiobacteriaceae bacterium]